MDKISTQFVGEEDNPIFEDGQSTCFICADQLSSQIDQYCLSFDKKYSIRAIFRHLKIKQESTTDKQPDTDDVVSFCDRCYQIFTILSSYCADLEVLQMRIRYFLNELNKLTVLKKTTSSVCTTDEARKQLKNKLVEQCTIYKQNCPFVSLPRIDVDQLRTTVDRPFVKDDSENSSRDELSDEKDKMSIIGQNHKNDVDYESYTSEPSNNNSIEPKRSHGTHSLQKQDKPASSIKKVPCLDCDCHFEMKSLLFEHSLQFHPEKHFPSKSKPDSLSLPQHKMYLVHLLNTEVDSCGSWGSGYKCSYCKFKTTTKRSFRNHIFKVHQDKLLENLVKLQMTISADEISTKVRIPTIRKFHRQAKEQNVILNQFCKYKNKIKSEYTCSICKVRTTSPRKHEALHHPDKFLLSKRSEKVSLEQFKTYCVYLINQHVEKFTKLQKDGKVRFHCIYCQNSYVDLQGCKNHLVLAHDDILLVEVEKLQQTMQPEELKIKPKRKYVPSTKKPVETDLEICKICNVHLTQRGIAIHMRKIHPVEYLKTYKCEACLVCKKTFRSTWWLDFHMISCHADKIFEEWRDSAIMMEQFRSYCDFMIDTEIKSLAQVNKANENIRYKCSYCSVTFCDTKYVQIHLVMHHKDKLVDKLKELQENKTVVKVEQQDDMVIKRKASGDRFGKNYDFEATEVFCGKSATKQETSESCDENEDEMMDFEDLHQSILQYEDINIKQELL